MYDRKILFFAVGFLLIAGAAHSETDVFMRAVGLALSGSDDVEAKAIDRANCVFAYKNDVFHLNNVHIDRIKIQGWKMGELVKWTEVELHGDDVVVDHTTDPMKDDGSDKAKQMRATYPELFRTQRNSYKQSKLHLYTSDVDRVSRAWQYIYSNGCVGKKSPF
jgi:hypothetical protein